MSTIKKWLRSPDRIKRIPPSYKDPKIFCDFAEVCATINYKSSRNCKICLDHLKNGTRNKQKEMYEGMYKSG